MCQILLPEGIEDLCPMCVDDFTYTYFEKYNEPSLLDQLFFGRVMLNTTFAMLYFTKQGSTQRLVHDIKYANNTQLAFLLGKKMGHCLLSKWPDAASRPDVLLPIPLHPKKKHVRGYNQSALLAQGMSGALDIPTDESILLRKVNTSTQTKKGKYERWDNVEDIFRISKPGRWKNKHLCIIDDVITTGATIESCVRILQRDVEGVQISVVCLAIAK